MDTDFAQQWAVFNFDPVGYGPGEYISNIKLNPIEFSETSRGAVATMAGGGVEKFVVIKAGPSGSTLIKTHTTVVGMNMDDPDSEDTITTTVWAYAIMIGN